MPGPFPSSGRGRLASALAKLMLSEQEAERAGLCMRSDGYAKVDEALSVDCLQSLIEELAPGSARALNTSGYGGTVPPALLEIVRAVIAGTKSGAKPCFELWEGDVHGKHELWLCCNGEPDKEGARLGQNVLPHWLRAQEKAGQERREQNGTGVSAEGEGSCKEQEKFGKGQSQGKENEDGDSKEPQARQGGGNLAWWQKALDKPKQQPSADEEGEENLPLPVLRLSKNLASLLRHRAAHEGLAVRSDGFARLDEALSLPCLQRVLETVAPESAGPLNTGGKGGAVGEGLLALVREMVGTSRSRGKPRFELWEGDGETWIRATHKHTLAHVTESPEMTGSFEERADERAEEKAELREDKPAPVPAKPAPPAPPATKPAPLLPPAAKPMPPAPPAAKPPPPAPPAAKPAPPAPPARPAASAAADEAVPRPAGSWKELLGDSRRLGAIQEGPTGARIDREPQGVSSLKPPQPKAMPRTQVQASTRPPVPPPPRPPPQALPKAMPRAAEQPKPQVQAQAEPKAMPKALLRAFEQAKPQAQEEQALPKAMPRAAEQAKPQVQAQAQPQALPKAMPKALQRAFEQAKPQAQEEQVAEQPPVNTNRLPAAFRSQKPIAVTAAKENLILPQKPGHGAATQQATQQREAFRNVLNVLPADAPAGVRAYLTTMCKS